MLSSVGFLASAPEPAHQIYTRASDSHSRFFFAPLCSLSFPLRTGRQRLRPSSSSLARHRARGRPQSGHGGCDRPPPPPPLPLASRRALKAPGAGGARRRPQATAQHRPSSATTRRKWAPPAATDVAALRRSLLSFPPLLRVCSCATVNPSCLCCRSRSPSADLAPGGGALLPCGDARRR